MYEAYLDGKLLYYPGDKINALVKAELHTKLNDSGTFEITIPTTNPLHDKFQPRISELTVFKNGEEIWNGEIRTAKEDFKKQKAIKAVGELAYLTASSQPQKKYTNESILQVFTELINIHNSQVEPRKQFEVGVVTVEDSRKEWITNYEDTLDYLRSELCEKTNGYLRIRKIEGKRYLDLVQLKDYGKSCNQPIKFGKNLLDYAKGITADSIATVVRPLGASLDNSKIEGIDSYVTIESVNDGKDYIENREAIESGIGYAWRTVHFNVLTDPASVKKAGENWLEDNQFANITIDVTAVDLSDLNVNIDAFELGDSVRTIAKPYGMDRWSYITERKIDLLNPVKKHNISIGEKVKKSYTQIIASENSTMKKEMPQKAAILELAKGNASELIKNATEGNIYTVYDENGKPKELLIMDTDDIKTAQKVWRWNQNGFGYSSTGYDGEYALAMTMDGSIVADRITTGILNSIKINNGNGKFSVDENGKMVATSGELAGWNINSQQIFKVIDLYSDMSSEGLSNVGDNDPVQYWVWIRKPTNGNTPVFGIYYKKKSDYLANNDVVYRKFAAYANGEVIADTFKSSNANITGGSINIQGIAYGYTPIILKGTSGQEIEIGPYILRLKHNNYYAEVSNGLISTGYFSDNTYTPKASMHFDGKVRSDYAYENVTSYAANTHIDSIGVFRRSSSSSNRYKEDITEELCNELDPQKLYKLPVKQFKYKEGYLCEGDQNIGKDIIGFIVEDLENVYKSAVQYDTEGKPEMWNDKILIPAMLKLIQEQNERILRLEERIGGAID